MKVILIGEYSYQWILIYFAVVNSGNIVVPLDPKTYEDDLITLIRKTAASCVVCSNKYLDKIQKIHIEIGIEDMLSYEVQQEKKRNRQHSEICVKWIYHKTLTQMRTLCRHISILHMMSEFVYNNF